MNKMERPPDIETAFAIDINDKRKKVQRERLLFGAFVFAMFVVFAMFLRGPSGSEREAFVTRTVAKGDLTVTVTATGTIEPRKEVRVGIEVSGTVEEVFVDHNDTVEAGDVLARLDTTILAAQAAQARAAVEVAQARRVEAKATLAQTENDLARLRRLHDLSGGAVPSAQEIVAAQAARDRAAAVFESAGAQLLQNEALYKVDATELEKAEVFSPIRGVVLSRLVDPGQTVAAALQTPEMFIIAEDLTEMELSIEVDEADVGQVREGQTAIFTVDSYPDEEFPAAITQVRFQPIVNGGVVVYEAILSVDNSDLRLRPGMTATAIITTDQISNAVLVPNEALRFAPRQAAADSQESGGIMSALVPRPPDGNHASAPQIARGKNRQIWTLNGEGELAPVSVQIGASDGAFTQIVSDALKVGDEVVTEQRELQ